MSFFSKPEQVTPNGAVKLVRVPSGSFLMGAPENDLEADDGEQPQRRVSVASFWIGRYPVTNEEYGRYLTAHPEAERPMYWRNPTQTGARHPVVGVSWDDARTCPTGRSTLFVGV
jgi:formylglycine-generating enzyme required for sulfatase activity